MGGLPLSPTYMRDYKRNRRADPEKWAAEKAYNRAWRKQDQKKNPEKYREYGRRAYAKNPERVKRANFKSRYGISLDDWQIEFDRQERRCKICGRDISLSKVATDHCHKTKKFRGILCQACNFMLGNAADNPDRLRAGAAYLEAALECN